MALDNEPEATLRVKSSPEPDTATVCGLLLASSATLRVPDRLPTAVGVKVTLMVQLAPAPTELPQLLVCAKSPVVLMFEIVSTPPLEFDNVTACDVLVVPRRLPGARRDLGRGPAAARPGPSCRTR